MWLQESYIYIFSKRKLLTRNYRYAQAKAEAKRIFGMTKLQQSKLKRDAQIAHGRKLMEIEVAKAKKLADIEVSKFKTTVDALGSYVGRRNKGPVTGRVVRVIAFVHNDNGNNACNLRVAQAERPLPQWRGQVQKCRRSCFRVLD